MQMMCVHADDGSPCGSNADCVGRRHCHIVANVHPGSCADVAGILPGSELLRIGPRGGAANTSRDFRFQSHAQCQRVLSELDRTTRHEFCFGTASSGTLTECERTAHALATLTTTPLSPMYYQYQPPTRIVAPPSQTQAEQAEKDLVGRSLSK